MKQTAYLELRGKWILDLVLNVTGPSAEERTETAEEVAPEQDGGVFLWGTTIRRKELDPFRYTELATEGRLFGLELTLHFKANWHRM